MIIGVIAAITVPSLMNNTNGHEYQSKVKKAISSVNQALTLHYALEGLGVRDYHYVKDLVNNIFKKRMNVMDVDFSTFPDDYSLAEMCYPNSSNSFVTQDGVIFCIYSSNFVNGYFEPDKPNRPCNSFNTQSCTSWNGPNLFFDINGLKKPNRATIMSSQTSDVHFAKIYNTKVEPWGATIDVMTGVKDINIDDPRDVPPSS